MTPDLDHRLESGEINFIDYYFCRFISELEDNRLNDNLQHLVADLSHALTEQHSCLDLSQKSNAATLISSLENMSSVGDGTRPTPLVLEGSKLYLHRYFSYEQRIATDLARRNRSLGVEAGEFGKAIESAFPNDNQEFNWQRLAALQALTRQLTVITGGPGTGKTSTVVKILALLLEGQELNVKLAAPTGKAAMRLNETVNATLPYLSESVRSRMPDQVQTIHRLLGMRPDGRSARYNEKHLLPVDFLVLDEVSMIDLALMDRLLRATPDHTRLLLLGDPDQLPSVDVGNILADISRYPAGFSASVRQLAHETLGVDLPDESSTHLLTDAVCRLQRSYRFSSSKGIGQLAASIREGSVDLPKGDDEVSILDVADLSVRAGQTLANTYTAYLEHLKQKDVTANLLIDAFDRTRILSPVREGELGVEQINEKIEAHLRSTGWTREAHRFYHGRPVIIMRNDYTLGLFNGDTGITLFDPEDNQFKVAFKGIDGEIKWYLASRLPPHETCFAMTVHKSQGSEFEHVTLILPDDLRETGERILTRELLYTAVTRTRRDISIYLNRSTYERCIARGITRHSGLNERFLSDPITEHVQ